MSRVPDVTTNQQLYAALSALISGEHLAGPIVNPVGGDAAFWEPTDSRQPLAVTGLTTTANGGQEIKFSQEGLIATGPGAIGVYWSRNLKQRWTPLLQGRFISYVPDAGFFVGTDNTGVTPAGVLSLEFYAKPDKFSWKQWTDYVGRWTRGAGPDMGMGAVIGTIAASTSFGGTDVTLGTFSHLSTDAAQQISLVGSNMLVGGATKKCQVIVSAPYTNTDEVYVAETAALAVASNNALSATGQDTWSIPATGKLFFKSASGTQKVSARARTA